jgi:hypothetical protein
MTFQLPPEPADMHGLAFYFDGTAGQLSAMPLTPPDEHVAIAIDMLKKSAATFLSPISKVAAEAIALSVQYQQPERASMFAQAAHELTGDHFFLVHRGAAVGPCEATYDRLPIQTLEQAQHWIASVTGGLKR